MSRKVPIIVLAPLKQRNNIIINHNVGYIDDDEFVVLYDLYASKNLDFPLDSYALLDLEN